MIRTIKTFAEIILNEEQEKFELTSDVMILIYTSLSQVKRKHFMGCIEETKAWEGDAETVFEAMQYIKLNFGNVSEVDIYEFVKQTVEEISFQICEKAEDDIIRKEILEKFNLSEDDLKRIVEAIK